MFYYSLCIWSKNRTELKLKYAFYFQIFLFALPIKLLWDWSFYEKSKFFFRHSGFLDSHKTTTISIPEERNTYGWLDASTHYFIGHLKKPLFYLTSSSTSTFSRLWVTFRIRFWLGVWRTFFWWSRFRNRGTGCA